jgi:hypothetical protein
MSLICSSLRWLKENPVYVPPVQEAASEDDADLPEWVICVLVCFGLFIIYLLFMNPKTLTPNPKALLWARSEARATITFGFRVWGLGLRVQAIT